MEFRDRPYADLTEDERKYAASIEKATADLQDMLVDSMNIRITNTELTYWGRPVLWGIWRFQFVSHALKTELAVQLQINCDPIRNDRDNYLRHLFMQAANKYLQKVWEGRRK